MSASGEGEGKRERLLGTNDSSNAVGFMDDLDEQIKVHRLQKLMHNDYEPENIEELSKRWKDQRNRVREFEGKDEQRRVLINQINAIIPAPGPGDPMVIAYNVIVREIHDMEWKGRSSEEGTEEKRRNEFNQATTKCENLVAEVALVEQYIKRRVEASIYGQIKLKTEGIEEPGKKLKKMYDTVKGLVGGDQVRERKELLEKLENLQPAGNDSECKERINEMRVIRQKYRDSAKAERKVMDIEEEVLIEKLGEIVSTNSVDFEVKFEYRINKRTAGMTFERLAEGMETCLDKSIRKKYGENGAKGMAIDNQRAVAEQAIGMAAGASRSTGSGLGQREKRDGDCFDWLDGYCGRGDSHCWYRHDPKKFGTKKREQRGGNRGSRRSSSFDEEERDRDRNRSRDGIDRSRDRSRTRDTSRGDRDRSSERDRAKNNYGRGEQTSDRNRGREKDRRSSSSRSPDNRNRRESRSRDSKERSRSSDRDGDRTPTGNNTPTKPPTNGGGGGRRTW